MSSDAGWKELSLGEVLELKRGYDLPKRKRKVGVIPIVSSSGISDFHSVAMAKGPGVVTGRYGTIGEVYYIDGDFWPLNTALYVRDFKGNDPRFISYFLKTLDFQSFSDKGAVPGVNRNHLHTARVRIPELRTQKAIAKVLDALDRKIELNRRINQTLETMAQAIFKSWFVDFDPVRAKIAALEEGEDPLRAAMCALSGKTDAELEGMSGEDFEQLAAMAALFPDAMEDSELGEIPRGWGVDSLSELCNLNPTSWSIRSLPDIVQYVDLSNAKNGEIIDVQIIGEGEIPSRARRILEPGDTIVGTVRPGNRSFALVGDSGLTGSTGFAVLRPKQKFMREFVYLSATSDENIERLAHLADGAAYPAVRPDVVINNTIVFPGKSVLKAFHVVASKFFDKVLVRREENQQLAEIRDVLLPELMSGELSF